MSGSIEHEATASETLGRHLSPWVAGSPASPVAPAALPAGRVDVVVVGAGITGLTTALLLQQAGRRVAVIEGRRVLESVTTHSTVKVTVGHGLRYSSLAGTRGMEAAAVYASANAAGLAQIVRLADTLGLDCMLETGLPHVVYAESGDDVERIEQEAIVAEQLGLPVRLTADVPLPFPVAAALSFDGQAQFHPGQYVAGLARAFVAGGGVLAEQVWVRDVDEDGGGCQVTTTAGQVSAGHVVVATHYPMLDRGGQFTELSARRSYGIAAVLPPGVPAGMTINVTAPTRSTRLARLDGEDLLIVVGEGHRAGHDEPTAERWTALHAWARERFGTAEVRYHWSAQEVATVDGFPFVGFVTPRSDRVLTATGFDGWGMTNGTAAAVLLRDLVTGSENPWASTFGARPATSSLSGATQFVTRNVQVGLTWVKGHVGGTGPGSPEDLAPGQAAVLEVDGERTAAYRDGAGRLHAVSATCTHLGCTVAWNDAEASWDCPCHGSRFAPDGSVLHSPASTPLPSRSDSPG